MRARRGFALRTALVVVALAAISILPAGAFAAAPPTAAHQSVAGAWATFSAGEAGRRAEGRAESARLATAGADSALVSRPAATGSSIVGVAVDSYSSEHISGVTVNLYADDGTTKLASTETTKDGSYSFTGLDAGTYLLYFEDGSGRYDSTWWDWEGPDVTYADPVVLDADTVYAADEYMDALNIQFRSTFTTLTIQPDATDIPVDESFTLSADLQDYYWGFGYPGMPVVVQSSLDRSTWTTVGAAAEDPYVEGHYSADVTVPDTQTRYYRFSMPTVPGITGSTSSVRAVHGVPVTVSWGPTSVNGVQAPALVVTTTPAMFTIDCDLHSQTGALFGGVPVEVWRSVNGSSWSKAPAIVRETTRGHFQISTEDGYAAFYRLQVAANGKTNAAVSATFIVVSPRMAQCWTNSGWVHHGRNFEVTGWIWSRSKAGSHPGTVEVQRKVGGRFVTYKRLAPKIRDGIQGSSRFNFKMKVTKRGEYRIRLSVPGEGWLLPNTSAWQTFYAR